ncbi:acyl-CoA dehydrogenase family protein [Thermomonospora amylolytica]|uniref:acyl-CoA dehydrogenase family protein n=1 Tax=Thermomonospora amylolytica TaxID=1411117 RepID=UPI000E6D25B6|nr:acyl-CoA dehydrogenase family protein [Thermomonospora amylolytica]
MNFGDTPEEATFRQELRKWLAANVPEGPAPLGGPARAQFWAKWHRALFRGGWMGLSWPVEYGGRGLSPIYEAILADEVGAAGAPPVPHVGYLGRALLHYGTPEQRRRHLPGLLSGEETWCQGFSEPGAGSDLAALSTRAERAEDGGYRVHGQKVWTSDAAWADWCLLLARTDPQAPRHRGISALVVDMRAPGVTVRPIRQINGDEEFNEVFFDGTPVPADRLVGEPGQGWEIAMTTVSYERGPADIGFSSRYARTLRRLEEVARQRQVPPATRRELARAYVHTEVLRLHVLRSLSARMAGGTPGPQSSVDKLLSTRTEQLLHHAAMDLHGSGPLLGDDGEVLFDYLYSRGSSIAGGTSQIQHSIVAERLLGLPRAR